MKLFLPDLLVGRRFQLPTFSGSSILSLEGGARCILIGMICLSVLYTNAAGKRFDYDYYAQKHLPLARERLKDLGMTRYEIDRGVSGPAPGSPPAFLCIGRLYFDTLEGFQQGLAEHGPELLADVPNYTDAELVLQVSETSTG